MKLFKKIFNYLTAQCFAVIHYLRERRRVKYLLKERKKLNNHSFSLIANNCNGCVLLHELGIKFNSQFVNLFLNANDYIKYLENFDYYNRLDLSFDSSVTVDYPIGKLGDLKINFVHYKTAEEAREKWEERKKRINRDNIFIMFTEQDDCSPELIKRFNDLPFNNKVVFTYREYKDIESAIYCKRFKSNPLGVHMFFEYTNNFSSKRKYDMFSFVSWFNGETNLKKLIKG